MSKKNQIFCQQILGTFFCQIFAENWKLHNRELCKVRASKFRGRTVTLIWHYSLQCSYHFWQTSLVFYNYRPRQGTPYHNGLKSILKEHFYLPRICNFSQIIYNKINKYVYKYNSVKPRDTKVRIHLQNGFHRIVSECSDCWMYVPDCSNDSSKNLRVVTYGHLFSFFRHSNMIMNKYDHSMNNN